MSIRIDRTKCIGCGRCVEACPGNLIRLEDDRRAQIRIVEECWGCTSCMKECPVSAISLFLGADIGGAGSLMNIKAQGNIYHWTIHFPDGHEKVISVDRTSSNKY